MALDRSVVNLNFARGLNTQPDPKQLEPGEFLTVENGTFETPKQLTKRNGFSPATTNIRGGGTLASARTAHGFNGGVFLGDGAKAYIYASGGQWASLGYMPTGDLAVTPAPLVNNTTLNVDAALNQAENQVCVVWTAIDRPTIGVSYSQEYAIYQYTTGALIYRGTIVSGSYGPLRVVGVADRFIIARGGASGLLTRYHAIICSAPQTVVDLGASGVANFVMTDAFADAATASMYVGGYVSAGNATVESCNIVGTKANINTGEAANANYQVGIERSSNGVMICWVNGANLRAKVVNITLSASLSANTTMTALASGAGGSGAIALAPIAGSSSRIIWSDGATEQEQYTYTMTTTDTMIPSAPSVRSLYRYAWPVSRAWVDSSSNVYVAVRWRSTVNLLGFNPTFLAMVPNDNAGRSLVSVLANEAFSPIYNVSRNISVASDGVAFFGGMDAIGSTSVNSGGTIYNFPQYAPRFYRFDLGASPAPAVVTSGSVHQPGALLWQSDGTSVVEHGFPILPGMPSLSQAAAGFMADGAYSYRYCYAWTDAAGITHRSAPSSASPINIVAGGGTASVSAVCTPPNWSNRSQVVIELYRTVASGTLYYLTSTILVTPGVATAVVPDLTSDASLIANRQLYTTDGSIENIEIPAPRMLCQHRDRMWGVSALDPTVLWFSKPLFPGVPVEWSDSMTIAVPSGGEEVTAIGSLDDKLAVFTATRAFFVAGQGPGTNGLANDLTIVPILSAQGCYNPTPIGFSLRISHQASIGQVPDGLIFRSAKGWYLLDRSLGLSYIGSPVEDFNDFAAASTYLSEKTRELRIVLNSNIVLVYNYNQQQWSSFTLSIAAPLIASAAIGNQWGAVTNTGVLYVEVPGLYIDSATTVAMSVSTGWVSFGGLQNFQRVRRMMLLFGPNALTASTLTVSIAYDFDPTVAQTVTVPTAALQGTAQGAQFLIHLARQKCDAIKVTIQENNASGATDAGVSFSGLAFEVGVKKGLQKLPASRSA